MTSRRAAAFLPRARVHASQRRTLWVVLAVMPLVVSGLVVHATRAAFTASTASAGNSWSAGHVSLTSDANGSAVFSPTLLVPGDSGSACVTVTYGGNVDAAVKLYASALAGNLGTYLDLVVTEGTGATDAACTNFNSTGVLYTGTLAGFRTAHGTYLNGVSAWTPNAAASRSYKFDWALQDNNGAQSQTATATFTWEADST